MPGALVHVWLHHADALGVWGCFRLLAATLRATMSELDVRTDVKGEDEKAEINGGSTIARLIVLIPVQRSC